MTFHAWLMEQHNRADPVGDLARDARDDRDWPARARVREDFHRYLVLFPASGDALRAFDRAWTECERSGQTPARTRIHVPPRFDDDAADRAAGRSTP